MPPRLLPYVNFAIASVALAFQVGVLLPWHHELDKKFDESVISPPPSTVLPGADGNPGFQLGSRRSSKSTTRFESHQ
jgi:hypothetical protein